MVDKGVLKYIGVICIICRSGHIITVCVIFKAESGIVFTFTEQKSV